MSVRLQIDLFSGIGGFSYAADQVTGLDHEFVEYEPHLQRVLRKHWPSSEIHGDIRGYSAPKNPFLITGGFPCQDISRANKNKSKQGIYGERSGLWSEYRRVLQESRPTYCIIENVFDLLRNGLGRIISDLAEIGYDASWTTLDSQFFSAQRRRRIYIVAFRDGIADGADIFQCSERSRLGRGKILEQFSGIEKDEACGKEHGARFFGLQKTGIYRESRVVSTIRKCGWATGGDLVIENNTARHLTYREKLILQGFPPEWTEGCGLTEAQKHSANGMSIPAVKWVIEKLLAYDYSLDI
jgi:DNA-cytosine methyltransferase